jgi:cytochrome c biogenesis protein ResB
MYNHFSQQQHAATSAANNNNNNNNNNNTVLWWLTFQFVIGRSQFESVPQVAWMLLMCVSLLFCFLPDLTFCHHFTQYYLKSCGRIIEEMTVTHLMKKFPNPMDPEVYSLSSSQKPVTLSLL